MLEAAQAFCGPQGFGLGSKPLKVCKRGSGGTGLDLGQQTRWPVVNCING